MQQFTKKQANLTVHHTNLESNRSQKTINKAKRFRVIFAGSDLP
jgi:hypothetical protein